MVTSISPTNPGVIYDPRERAAEGYLAAVQADLNDQTKEFGMNIQANKDIYDSRYKPLPDNLFTPDGNPNPALKGFTPGRRTGFGGVIGVLGGVRRIG